MTDRYGQAKATVDRVKAEAEREYNEWKDKVKSAVGGAKDAYRAVTGGTAGKALTDTVSKIGGKR